MEVLRRLHDTPLAGHLGQKRTLELVQRKYYWPKMKTDIEDYCLRCTQCRKNKAETHATFGSLMPLAPAERPWSRVGIDLITDLPKTKNGHDSIQVHVDHFGKGIALAATKKESGAKDAAILARKNVISKKGIPRSWVMDRDKRWLNVTSVPSDVKIQHVTKKRC
jgi:hypothetical protein